MTASILDGEAGISVEKGCVDIDWPILQTRLLEENRNIGPMGQGLLCPRLFLESCALCLVPGALQGKLEAPGKLNLCSILRSISSTLCLIHGVAHHPSIDQGPADGTRLGALPGRRRSCDGPTNLGGGKVNDRVEAYQVA